MSFSSIALQQRKKELKALRIFLACSLASSLLFHIALLASGIDKLLKRIPKIENEIVEITLIDSPLEEIEPQEEEKPKPEPEKIEPKQEKLEPEKIEPKQEKLEPEIAENTPSESQISGGSPATSPLFERIPTQPKAIPQQPPVVEKTFAKLDIPPIKPLSPPPPLVQQKPEIPQPKPELITPPKPELLLESKALEEFSIPTTSPIEQPKPIPEVIQPRELSIPTSPPVEQPKPIPQPEPIKPREFSIPTSPPVEQPKSIPQQDNRALIDSLKESQENQKISSNNKPLSLPEISNSNLNESSNNPRKRRRIIGGSNIATAPSTIDSGIGNGTGNSVGDGDGRAACRQCNTSYPSWARKRGIEGQINVTVDTDAQGNIINVQLISGSGNTRLDKYHLKLARRWKLKPSSNGRQGVRIETRYQIK